MCNWSIDVSKMYFSSIVSRMKEIMFAEGVIHCDETYTEVLLEPDRPTSCKSYIWVTTTAEYQKDHPIAIYNYREGRSAIDAKAVLKGFSGYIMCDGYDSYGALQKKGKDGSAPMNVTLVACMVHVRRKFADALKLIPEKDRKGTSAQKAIDMIATITHADNKFKNLPRDERKEMRIKAVKPLMEAFFAWIL